MENKKKLKFPHVFILLLAVILFCSLLTYIIPAGVYDYVDVNGVQTVDPNSYHQVEATPVTLMGFLTAIPKGLESAAEIIFFIFIIAGSFNALQDTGAIEAGLCRIASSKSRAQSLLLPLIMFVLALGGSFIGMCEETIVFIPITISLAMALGYDSLTGLATVLLGSMAGFSAAIMNPFNVGIAQGIAELPIFSGMGLRIVMFSVTVAVTIFFVMRYANKVKKSPQLSPMYEVDIHRDGVIDLDNIKPFTVRRKITLLAAVAFIALLIFGVLNYGWYLTEIAGLFFAMGLVCSLIGGMSLNEYAESMAKGMGSVTEGAMVVGLAKGVLVVMEAGNIIGTILYSSAAFLSTLPTMVSAEGMYVFQSALSFIIPSGSGQAAVTIPIMTPLSDLVGVTRQTMVLGFQMADGISEILTPTAGWFMAALSIAKVPYTKWIKWVLPITLTWYAIGAIFVAYAQITGYGPF